MLDDTIYAIASPPGAAARGILRLSGPDARTAANRVLVDAVPAQRATVESAARVLGYTVPCLVLVMPAPGSYTGEDVVELHLPGSPVLLDEVAGQLDVRLATPGEFTRRAFEHGRLDLAAAEAVMQLIHAAGIEESRFALDVLRGGLATAVAAIRGRIQDGLAWIEAGLDFAEGETGAVAPDQWLPPLREARAQCCELRANLPQTGVHGEVLLVGAANAGKSALANALAETGSDAALVADGPGTTRDVLAFDLAPGLRLLDGPGDLDDPGVVDQAALALRDRLAERVAGVIHVIDSTAPVEPRGSLPVVARVFTKCDLMSRAVDSGADPIPAFVVSSVTGTGIAELREFLRSTMGGGPSGLSDRLHGALTEVVDGLDRTLHGAQAGQPEELLAVDLAAALLALDRIDGRSTPEDLLDRIFAGFCLGK